MTKTTFVLCAAGFLTLAFQSHLIQLPSPKPQAKPVAVTRPVVKVEPKTPEISDAELDAAVEKAMDEALAEKPRVYKGHTWSASDWDNPGTAANIRSAKTGKQCESNFDGSVWCPR